MVTYCPADKSCAGDSLISSDPVEVTPIILSLADAVAFAEIALLP